MDPQQNWNNWLAGQSYLETDYQNEGNPTSSAKGYFQFLNGTANKAMAAGLPDPRAGGYTAQANAARAYIERFYPQAAAAINRGDYQTATTLLRGEWPSLPGGSQQQNPSRYGVYQQILAGGGPRPDETPSTASLPSYGAPAPNAQPAPQLASVPGVTTPTPDQNNAQPGSAAGSPGLQSAELGLAQSLLNPKITPAPMPGLQQAPQPNMDLTNGLAAQMAMAMGPQGQQGPQMSPQYRQAVINAITQDQQPPPAV